MPIHIAKPTVIEAAGNLPKRIEEYAGRVNSGHAAVSVARMVSPSGWREPGQRPDFEEITVVLRGVLRVEHEGGEILVRAGEAVVTHPGEWVRWQSVVEVAASTEGGEAPRGQGATTENTVSI
jgi:quercetin dioxygenase-like cupin family protein